MLPQAQARLHLVCWFPAQGSQAIKCGVTDPRGQRISTMGGTVFVIEHHLQTSSSTTQGQVSQDLQYAG